MSIKIRDAAGKEVEVAGGGGSPDAVTVPSGAVIEMSEGIGEGSFTIKFTPEEDSPELDASEVGYDNASSGLEAETVQGAVDEVAAAVKAVRAKQEAGMVYSSEEVLVGTWIDGKPLYRKVFFGTFEQTKIERQTVLVGALDNASIIRIAGSMYSHVNDASYTLPYVEFDGNNSTFSISVLYINNTISMNSYIFTGTFDFRLIVEYTKTTDGEEV